MLLTIEKLVYGGDGLARLPVEDGSADPHGRGKAVFVPFVLTNEKVDATIIEEKRGFARAQAESVVAASVHRVSPGCRYFGACGGCHYQHSEYEHQLEIKKEILRENLRRIAKAELSCEIEVHAAATWNYRNRTRLQVQTRPEFATGYFKMASHELLPVEECPISSSLINRGMTALWQAGRAGKFPEGIREVEFFANADDTRMLVEVFCSPEAKRAEVRAWVEQLRGLLPKIAGVAALRERSLGARSAKPDEFLIAGERHLTYQTRTAAYRVSVGSFFQTNRFLVDELVKIVTQGRSGEVALDLYAGVGLFSTVLARDFHHVISVEASQIAAADLKYNLPSNGEVIQVTAEQYLSHSESRSLKKARRPWKGAFIPTVHRPDLAVVDPPRGGLGERVARSLASLGAPRITYVACDPATLARDLVCLLDAGYRVEQAHLVDLFPQTYHLETVMQLVK